MNYTYTLARYKEFGAFEFGKDLEELLHETDDFCGKLVIVCDVGLSLTETGL
jgi:hypothetical protein